MVPSIHDIFFPFLIWYSLARASPYSKHPLLISTHPTASYTTWSTLSSITFKMSTSIYNSSEAPRKNSTTSRHRRSTISLHSPPGLGLMKTISRDLVTGWHTHTALQKEPSTPTPVVDTKNPYKPKHAARDAMRGFALTTSHNQGPGDSAKTSTERTRQDSVVPTPTEIDGTKPLACVEQGLIPDHRNDTWTAVWNTAYERRKDTDDFPSPCLFTKEILPLDNIAAAPGKATTASRTTERRRSSRSSRPPMSSSFSVTDAEIKAFIFEDRRAEGYESPEAFLRPKSTRRGSEVPSLVPSPVTSEGSGLEDLEEKEEEGKMVGEVETPGKEVGKSGGCMHCSRCGGCARKS